MRSTPPSTMPGVARGLPRIVEVAVASVGLIVVAPLLAATAMAIKLSSPGPVFFRQDRVGREGKRFGLIKFRSMRVHRGGAQVTAGDDDRITWVGRYLRRTKLDELPTLWNVVRGDLAFVGPRPEVPRFVDLDDARWRAVLTVRPGITDPVTLRLRDEEAMLAGIEDTEAYYRRYLVPFKLAGYRAYLDQRTPWRDLGVIVRTLLGIARIGRVAAPTRAEIEAAGE